MSKKPEYKTNVSTGKGKVKIESSVTVETNEGISHSVRVKEVEEGQRFVGLELGDIG